MQTPILVISIITLSIWNYCVFSLECPSFWLLQCVISSTLLWRTIVWRAVLFAASCMLLLLSTPVPHHGSNVKDLRILPLGDSITFGYGSTDENGYRSYLAQSLEGFNVDYIGEMHTGNMVDNHSEGRPGERINETISYSAAALAQQPNVIILHVGSNDLVWDDDTINAPARLLVVLERVFEDCPKALVLLSELGPSTNDYYSARMDAFNRMLPRLEGRFASLGYRIMTVDAPAYINPSTDLFDDIHPNNAGYQKMARSYAEAISQAISRDMIIDPIVVPLPSLSRPPRVICSHNPLWIPLGRLATGDDGSSTQQPLVLFADINSDGHADYLHFTQNTLQPYLNLGHPSPDDPAAPPVTWLPLPPIQLPFHLDAASPSPLVAQLDPALPPMILLPRRDGFVDGYSLLAAPNPLAAPFSVVPYGPVVPALAPDGHGVRFADIDGDGKPDYLYRHADGSVSAWLNHAYPPPTPPAQPSAAHAGTSTKSKYVDYAEKRAARGSRRPSVQKVSGPQADTPLEEARVQAASPAQSAGPSWLPLGQIFVPPPGALDLVGAETLFEDLDGDGRADALLVARDGVVRAWMNGGAGAPMVGEWRGSGNGGSLEGQAVEGPPVTEEGSVQKRDDERNVNDASKPQGRRHRHSHKGATSASRSDQSGSSSTTPAGVPESLSPSQASKANDSASAITVPLSTKGTSAAATSAAKGPSKSSKKHAKPQDGGSKSQPQTPKDTAPKDFMQEQRPPFGSVPMAEQPQHPAPGWVWEDRGVVASGVGAGGSMRTRFADLDGDGRAEYLVVSDGGETWGWKNGCE